MVEEIANKIEDISDGWFQTAHLLFKDKGSIGPKRKTRKYEVYSRYNKSLLGFVKWYAKWRAYVFFPINCIIDKACMRELADFCDEFTKAQKARAEVAKAEQKKKWVLKIPEKYQKGFLAS